MPADASSLSNDGSPRGGPYSKSHGKAKQSSNDYLDNTAHLTALLASHGAGQLAGGGGFGEGSSMLPTADEQQQNRELIARIYAENEKAAKEKEEEAEKDKPKKSIARRHVSCENCRTKKMKCSRSYPCASCKMRNEECRWLGATPNGAADEDELQASQTEILRLKKLIELLTARLDGQDQSPLVHTSLPPLPSGINAAVSAAVSTFPNFNPTTSANQFATYRAFDSPAPPSSTPFGFTPSSTASSSAGQFSMTGGSNEQQFAYAALAAQAAAAAQAQAHQAQNSGSK